jgi:hypothetical protein
LLLEGNRTGPNLRTKLKFEELLGRDTEEPQFRSLF